jgi:hypothetical protein
MARNQDSLNKELYQLLNSRGFNPQPIDINGKVVPTPDDAVMISFDFTDNEREVGKVQITVDTENGVTVYFDDEVRNERAWAKFMKHLKDWAMRKQLGFEPKNSDHLRHDMAQRQYTDKKEKLGEGYHAMGKKASYNDAIPTVKIILQHNRQLEEGEQRYRSIAKIFLENQDGERFLAPTTRPGIAQVYARHIAEGGVPNDERWNHVKSMCEEYNKMGGFVRAVKSGQFNESAQQLVNEGISHYQSLRETLGKLRGHRGYNQYFESWTPALMEDDTNVESINELFVEATLDPRIESVMPILSRLNKNKATTTVKEVAELEEWADQIVEQGVAEGLGQTQYSLTDSTGKELRTINADSAQEAFELALKLIGPNERLRNSFGLVKLTSSPYYVVRNGQRKGVAEGSESDEDYSNMKMWSVNIMNNYYDGKYADYHARVYRAIASSEEEARKVVLDNADAILKRILAKKLPNGKRVLPPKSALPITDEEIRLIKPTSMPPGWSGEFFTPYGLRVITIGENGELLPTQQGVAEGITDAGMTIYKQVVKLLDDGYEDEQIADELGISLEKVHDILDRKYKVGKYSKGNIKPDSVDEGLDKSKYHDNTVSPKAGDSVVVVNNTSPSWQRGETFEVVKVLPNGMLKVKLPDEDGPALDAPLPAKWTRVVKTEVEEDLDADQKRVKQLGPTEKVGKKGAVGKLVGANESRAYDEEVCSNCDGTGRADDGEECEYCEGTGEKDYINEGDADDVKEAVAHDSPEETVIMDIVNGNIDPYQVMTHPKTEAERIVSGILQDMYDDVSTEHGLYDDDFEKVLNIVVDRLADEYDPYPMSESIKEGHEDLVAIKRLLGK